MLTNKSYLPEVFCRALVLILCMSLATGCTTLKPVASTESQSIMSQIKPGDKVQLTTRDGRVRELILKETSEKNLVADEEVVALSDITNIERREFSTWKTTTLVVGVITIIAVVLGSLAGTGGASWGNSHW